MTMIRMSIFLTNTAMIELLKILDFVVSTSVEMSLFVAILLTTNIFAQQFMWDTVKIGGGGYTIGLTQSKTGQIFSRTDVGGIYRFDKDHWQPLMDSFPINDQNLFGTDGFSVSPNDPNTIYTVSGMYEWDEPHFILKTSEAMNNSPKWQRISPIENFNAGGNEKDRWTGKRLIAINDSSDGNDTLYLGTRMQGLFKSIDSGNRWNQITSFPFKNSTDSSTVPPEHLGILWVNVNSLNTTQIFVMLYEYGIYQSLDKGKTWKNIVNLTCYRSIFDKTPDGNTIYMTCEEGVYSFNITTQKLTNISPMDGDAYVGIDISGDGETLFVSQRCSTNGNPWNYNPIYYTKLGSTLKWNKINYDNIRLELPWISELNWFAACVSDIMCDNQYSDCRRLLYSDFFMVWFNDNIWSTDNSTNLWYTHVNGHEEMFAFGFATPPKNNNSSMATLISGEADCGGFRHIEPNEYPVTNYRLISESFMGIDFCEKDPNFMVLVTGGEGLDANNVGFISYDNGVNINNSFPSSPPIYNNDNLYGGRIYINPNDCNHWVWIPLSNYPYVTLDAGKTWTKSNGAPMNVSGVVSGWENNPEWTLGFPMHFMNDRKNGNYWYIWDFMMNIVYISNDGGFNFTMKYTELPGFEGDHTFQGGYLSTDFSKEGKLCICLGLNGLYCSYNYGEWFEKRDNIVICRMVTFGIDKSGNGSVMYIYGLTNDDKDNGKNEGCYMIDNESNGEIIRMNNNTYQLGDNVRVMMGDRNTYGTVYVGSNGRGIYYSSLL